MAFEDSYTVFAAFFVVSGLFAADGAKKISSDESVKVEVKIRIFWKFDNFTKLAAASEASL